MKSLKYYNSVAGPIWVPREIGFLMTYFSKSILRCFVLHKVRRMQNYFKEERFLENPCPVEREKQKAM